MITVRACIVHEVKKEPKSEKNLGLTTFDLSEALLEPTDEFVVQLLSSIHASFGDDSALRNTHFEKDQSTVFSNQLAIYLNPEGLEDFLNFSVRSLKALKPFIDKENFAIGGYYVFADYTMDGRRFVSVMVVRKNQKALDFKKEGKVHKPTRAENINIEKIAMGFRLNFNLYEASIATERAPEDEKNYIALLAGQQDRNLSGYFKDWVNAAGIISNDKNSTTFVDIIKSIDLPVDENGKELITRQELKRKAYTYAEESRKKVVDVNAFSAFVFGDNEANRIMNYATSQGFILDPEFKRSSTIFKKLTTIHANVPGIELNIDYERINPQEVEVQTKRIVIHSKKLVEQINSQR